MSKAKLQAARELIESKNYDAARAILKTIDHPTAEKWLAKLDEIAPPVAAARKPMWASGGKLSRGKKIRIGLLVVGLFIIVMFVIDQNNRQQNAARRIQEIRGQVNQERLFEVQQACLIDYPNDIARYNACVEVRLRQP